MHCHPTLCLLAALAFAVFGSTTGFAQQDFEQIELEQGIEVLPNEMIAEFVTPPQTKAQVLAAKNFQLKNIFANEIRKMDKICQLDKKQKLKFKIGAKGASKKLSEEWFKKNEQNLQWMLNPQVFADGPIAVEGDDEDEEEEPKPEDAQPVEVPTISDVDEIDPMIMQMVVMDGMDNPFQSSLPQDSKFWKKLVQETLTEGQIGKLKAHEEQQSKKKIDLLLQMLMNNLDREMTLSESQITELRELIRPELENVQLNSPSFYEPFLFNYYASKVSVRRLKKVLSAEQLQQWKFYMAPAKEIGAMIEMEAMGEEMAFDDEFGMTEFLIGEALEALGDVLIEMFSK